MDVGKRITYFRNKRNISVNKLANLSGVSQSFLRDIELGNKQPTVEYLEYICYGLGITLKEFFDIDQPISELEEAINSLDNNQKELLAKFIKSIK